MDISDGNDDKWKNPYFLTIYHFIEYTYQWSKVYTNSLCNSTLFGEKVLLSKLVFFSYAALLWICFNFDDQPDIQIWMGSKQ